LHNRVTCGETYDDEDSCDPYDFLASDDELPGPDEDSEEVVVLMEDQLQAHDGTKAEMEFKNVLSNWTGMKVKCHELYAQANLPARPNLMDLMDLMQLDISILYKKLEGDDKGQCLYGFLPRMASCSEAQLGALNGNLVCTNANTLLLDEEISMLVILCMNESFMMHMHQYYKAEIKSLDWRLLDRVLQLTTPMNCLYLSEW
jgi:hypothetical protein